ncbi:MAG: HYR domain-containing protein, partial [FCB group bacterium]|nr:HYR domain-containing protein [FCB group bacterium]
MFALGTTQVEVIATDGSGNADTCYFNVTVNDTEDPVATCPADITVGNDAGQCGATVTFTPTATDNCSGVTVASNPASGTMFALGTTQVEVIATDGSGNADTCYFNVTVNDTEDPVATCPSDITVGNDAGQCGATVTFMPTATDNCSGVTITSNPASGTYFTGTTQVEVVATDASGNADTCYFNVTVNDTEDPVATCPADITVGNDAGQCGAVVTFTPTATDNCSGVTVTSNPASGTMFALGTTPVEVIATDGSGNADTCYFNVTVNDTEDPVATCPSDITVGNDVGQCGAVVTFTPTATDNCSGVTVTANPASGTMFALGTTPVEVIATDASGNADTCYFNVTVNDNEDPVATCPSDITVGTEAGACGATVTFAASVTDNCAGASVSCSPASGTFFAVGTTQVTCTALDASGNSSTCNFDVTVTNSAPVATCPGPQSYSFTCGPEEICFGTGFTAFDADDNIVSETVNHGVLEASAVCFTPDTTGMYPIAYTVTDACGATDVCTSFVYVLISNDPPVCDLPKDSSYFVCGDTTFSFNVSATDPDDNLTGCSKTGGAGSFVGNTWTFTTSGPGVYSATFECIDDCGLTCGGTVNITVGYNSPPVATCPGNEEFSVCDLAPITLSGFSCSDPDDNLSSCDVDNGSLSEGDVTFTPIAGVNTITLTATDECGATHQCQTQITINLNSPPVATCPGEQEMFVCDLSDITLDGFSCVDPDNNLASCDVDLGTYDNGEVTFSPAPGVNTITLTATDSCGAIDECQVEVTVTVNQMPTISLPDNDILFLCSTEQLCYTIGMGDPDYPANQSLPTAYLLDGPGTIVGDQLCFTPDEGTDATYWFKVQVCDSCGTPSPPGSTSPPNSCVIDS